MTQSQALSVLKTGVNVFLTGEPGSGKTHTVYEYISYLRNQGVEVAVTASTGIAATHIGGMTIHSWSGIGVKTKLEKRDLDYVAKNKHISTRVKRARVLVIEEISMLSGVTLSLIDSVCRKIKQNNEPFGGIQIVCVGDFFQLPPIIKQESSPLSGRQLTLLKELASHGSSRFAYGAKSWDELQPTICYLTEQHRQDDSLYLSILTAIRKGEFDHTHLKTLEQRKIEPLKAPRSVPKLYSHNTDVDQVNEGILQKISLPSRTYRMFSHGPQPLVSSLQKSCLSPERLCLKVGAAVMFTKNNQKEGFINGTLGEVVAFDTKSGFPYVRIRNGRQLLVEPMEWVMEENGETHAKIIQVPLRLAWAITVHKSQGMSFDEALIDLTRVFEFGQGYVALSRIRRLSGLYLLGYNERAFHVHPDVLAQDSQFRSQSEIVVSGFTKTSPSDFEEKHRQFIYSCNGKAISNKEQTEKNTGEKTAYSKIREKHPSAYRAWDQDQDLELRELYQSGSTIQELSISFSRSKGSIRSRLIKIGLLERN